jgi:Rrf2 family protein
MTYLAKKDGWSSAREISISEQVPEAFLEKIMVDLKGAGLVKAKRGSKGGYRLSREARGISVSEVVEALEDEMELAGCLSGGGCPHWQTCMAKDAWSEAQMALEATWGEMTISDLINDKQVTRDS